VILLDAHGSLRKTGTVGAFVDKISSRTAIQPITARIAVLANQFPESYPGDPCDRIIGAAALAEGLTLVTRDSSIRRYTQIKTIW